MTDSLTATTQAPHARARPAALRQRRDGQGQRRGQVHPPPRWHHRVRAGDERGAACAVPCALVLALVVSVWAT